MAELNRFGKNFFSKCVAASGARIDLDVEELWVSKHFRISLIWKIIIKMLERLEEMMEFFKKFNVILTEKPFTL